MLVPCVATQEDTWIIVIAITTKIAIRSKRVITTATIIVTPLWVAKNIQMEYMTQNDRIQIAVVIIVIVTVIIATVMNSASK